jgi:hypothetical protein
MHHTTHYITSRIHCERGKSGGGQYRQSPLSQALLYSRSELWRAAADEQGEHHGAPVALRGVRWLDSLE